jgi:hypothetical protein
MRQFIEILTNDQLSFENLPLWVYAIAMPLALILLAAFAGGLETA